MLLQTLNLLEGFDLRAMGSGSADALHTWAGFSTAKWDGAKLSIVTKQQMGDQAVETTEAWSGAEALRLVGSMSAEGRAGSQGAR